MTSDKITTFLLLAGVGSYVISQVATILGRELPPGRWANFFRRVGHDAKDVNQDIGKIVPGRIPVAPADPADPAVLDAMGEPAKRDVGQTPTNASAKPEEAEPKKA